MPIDASLFVRPLFLIISFNSKQENSQFMFVSIGSSQNSFDFYLFIFIEIYYVDFVKFVLVPFA